MKRIENIFFVVYISVGIFTIAVTPPFQYPDALTHFSRSYEVSEGELQGINKDGISGGYFPRSVIEFQNSFTYAQGVWSSVNLPKDEKTISDVNNYRKTLKLRDSGRQYFTGVPGVNSYPPLLYIPSSVGLLAGRLIGFPLLVTYYLCELINLIIFCILGRWCFSKLPSSASLFFAAVFFMPMTISMTTSFNPNGLVIGLTGVFFTLLFLSITESKISK